MPKDRTSRRRAGVPTPTMPVWVIIDDDKPTAGHRVRIRTTPVSPRYLVGPDRDCAAIPADLPLKAARKIAEWYEQHKGDDGES